MVCLSFTKLALLVKMALPACLNLLRMANHCQHFARKERFLVLFKQDSSDVSEWTNNKKPVDEVDNVAANDLKK